MNDKKEFYIYDVINKTCDIFSRITNKSITNSFSGSTANVMISTNKTYYHITMPSIDTFINTFLCIDKKYILKNKVNGFYYRVHDHELSQVLFTEFYDFYYRVYEHELSHVLFTEFSLHELYCIVKRKLKEIDKHMYIDQEILSEIINIIEDFRVDSLWNKIYYGSKVIQKQFLSLLCNSNCINNYTLLNKLFFTLYDLPIHRDNDVIFFQYIKELVEVSDIYMTILASVLTYVYITYFSIISKSYDIHKKIVHLASSMNMDLIEKTRSIYDIICSSKLNKHVLLNGLSIPFFELCRYDIHKSKGNNMYIDIDIKNMISSINTSKKLADNTVKEIVHKLMITKIKSRVHSTNDSHNFYLHSKNIYFPDEKIAKKIAKVLLNIYTHSTKINIDEGETIDINRVIELKTGKDKNIDIFITNKKNKSDIFFIFLLDISGSMYDKKIQIAVTSLLTIITAINKLDHCNIKYKVYVFPVYKNNNNVIDEVTFDVLQRIIPSGDTPTDKALKNIYNLHKHITGCKNILVLITDGEPNRNDTSLNELFSRTRDMINLLRNSGIDVFTFFIGSPNKKLTKIYGSPNTWEIVEDIEQLPTKLYRFVLHKISRNIRNIRG